MYNSLYGTLSPALFFIYALFENMLFVISPSSLDDISIWWPTSWIIPQSILLILSWSVLNAISWICLWIPTWSPAAYAAPYGCINLTVVLTFVESLSGSLVSSFNPAKSKASCICLFQTSTLSSTSTPSFTYTWYAAFVVPVYINLFVLNSYISTVFSGSFSNFTL